MTKKLLSRGLFDKALSTKGCIGSYLNNLSACIEVIDSHMTGGSGVCVCVSRSALFFDQC